MQSKLIDKRIPYTGKELKPHWIYQNFNISGDCVVAFIGPCDVPIDSLVDLEDVLKKAPIYSQNMLHFIIEHFNMSLAEAVCRQRLFIAILKDKINDLLGENKIIRQGDDLFYHGGKLSVSIATISPTSALIHIGVNIISEGTPVKAAGLFTDLKINDAVTLAEDVLRLYLWENNSIVHATYKVRGV